jgi:hypothetical protein
MVHGEEIADRRVRSPASTMGRALAGGPASRLTWD